MRSRGRRHVVVFGGGDVGRGEPAWRDAEALGRAVAEEGWALGCGGYGGVMEAASAGAAGAGGEVIGVLCSLFGSQGNAYLTSRRVTDSLFARLEELIRLGDAYVVLPGSTGTLVELALVWELMNKRLLSLRPLICLGNFWRPVLSLFQDEATRDPRLEPSGLPERKGELIVVAESPSDAVARLREAWRAD